MTGFFKNSIRLAHESLTFNASHLITFPCALPVEKASVPLLRSKTDACPQETASSVSADVELSPALAEEELFGGVQNQEKTGISSDFNGGGDDQPFEKRPSFQKTEKSGPGLRQLQIEPLHGHDFFVRVTIAGPLNGDGVVLDFVSAMASLKTFLETLHHKIFFAKKHPCFRFETEATFPASTKISFVQQDRIEKMWVLPTQDLLFLEMANATTEEIARWIAQNYFEILTRGGLFTFAPERYTLFLELEESPGMSATFLYNLTDQINSSLACEALFARFSWRR